MGWLFRTIVKDYQRLREIWMRDATYAGDAAIDFFPPLLALIVIPVWALLFAWWFTPIYLHAMRWNSYRRFWPSLRMIRRTDCSKIYDRRRYRESVNDCLERFPNDRRYLIIKRALDIKRAAYLRRIRAEGREPLGFVHPGPDD